MTLREIEDLLDWRDNNVTPDQFQQRYHDYRTPDRSTALAEAAMVNGNAHGFRAVVVDFEWLGYGLELESVAELIELVGPRIVRDQS